MKSIKIFLILFFTSHFIQAQKLTRDDYEKREAYIKTRDGVELYTAIYQPKNTKVNYPILITRTPYGCNPYGKEMPAHIMYNDFLVEEGYIFVYQDIRGRSMSDGEDMIDMKPVYSQKDKNRTDEATDAYDTFEWILKNVRNNNGKIGIYGNSYRGWTALMAALSNHKALKAVQIGAPCISDYFEDFYRYGIFTLGYVPIVDWFGTPKKGRVEGPWWERKLDYFSWYENPTNKLDKDNYEFFLQKGSLKNFDDLFSPNNYFWDYLKKHPNYDEVRKERNMIQYIKNINCPVLIVGGWNDEQNLYGIVKSYEAISKNNKSITNYIVGPWTHGDYAKEDNLFYVGNIYYGKEFTKEYLKKEFDFFESHLKKKANPNLPPISFFDTGKKEWVYYQEPIKTTSKTFFLDSKKMEINKTLTEENTFAEYISDPSKPVPYIEEDNFNLFVSKTFMTADQRFAYKRPDVVTFVTEPLTEDLTFSGQVDALLKFSTDHQDADIIVKLIDVLPMDRKPEPTDKPTIKMNGYQQMVRCGYIRGRYRDNFSKPKAFEANKVTDIHVELLNIHHTFKKGHKIMIQIQSSLFPLLDRNPQNYIENIFEANDNDFVKATHRIYSGSKIIFQELIKK